MENNSLQHRDNSLQHRDNGLQHRDNGLQQKNLDNADKKQLRENIEQRMLQLGVLTQQQQNQQNQIKNQQAVTANQTSPFLVTPLSEKAVTAKRELEILVATGKTKDLIGKQLTFQELDCMSEKDLMKYYSVYQQNIAARVNDAVSKLLISGYSKFVSCILPIEDKNKLYDDLRNDYVLMNEVDRWVGWFSIKAGSLMALGTASLITFKNCHIINDGGTGAKNSDGERDKIETSEKTERKTNSTQ